MIDTDTTLPLCTIPAKGIMWGTCRYSSEGNYIMLTPLGKGHLLKAKLPPAFLDRPAGHPLVDSCTREYRDWTKDLSGSCRKQKHSGRAFCLVVHQLPNHTLMIRGHLLYPRTSLWGCLCRGITWIHRSPSRPRPAVRPTATFINIHEHPL